MTVSLYVSHQLCLFHLHKADDETRLAAFINKMDQLCIPGILLVTMMLYDAKCVHGHLYGGMGRGERGQKGVVI